MAFQLISNNAVSASTCSCLLFPFSQDSLLWILRTRQRTQIPPLLKVLQRLFEPQQGLFVMVSLNPTSPIIRPTSLHPSNPPTQLSAVQQYPISLLKLRSILAPPLLLQVEPIQVHHLVPSRHKVALELLLAVHRSIHLRKRTKLSV